MTRNAYSTIAKKRAYGLITDKFLIQKATTTDGVEDSAKFLLKGENVNDVSHLLDPAALA